MKKTLLIVLAITLILSGCSPLTSSTSTAVPEPGYWPTSGWRSSSPEAQGMDSALLAKMLEDASAKQTNLHSLIIIRNATLVTEAYFQPYTRDTKMHIQSVTKSVIGVLVGKAIQMGAIKSVDQSLLSFFPNRVIANLSQEKDAIHISHLLSMTSGLDCQEFSSTGPKMEQSTGWVQFMLDLPVVSVPGKRFGYCNGNAHLLSVILEKSTDMNAREFANQELFQPLGIPSVSEADWGGDPQGFTIGGYGLHLKPLDIAKLALLYLQNGRWEGRQLLPANWVADSTTQQISKEDESNSGYGYLWTVYPQAGHYAALGLGGQQIHVYPSKNLIVIVTAGLNSYAEDPEIEKMLNQAILPATKSDTPLKENPESLARLQTAVERAGNPLKEIPELPQTAQTISGSAYSFDKNPAGWQKLELVFKPGAQTAQLHLNQGELIQIGLDNIYRVSNVKPFGELLLRGHWTDGQTFIIDYPYPFYGAPKLGELDEMQIQLKFSADRLDVSIVPRIFGGDPITFSGSR
jgi:CubicO group peptidase (beta-lactamase class C family)